MLANLLHFCWSSRVRRCKHIITWGFQAHKNNAAEVYGATQEAFCPKLLGFPHRVMQITACGASFGGCWMAVPA